jgi:hypothetical protein
LEKNVIEIRNERMRKSWRLGIREGGSRGTVDDEEDIGNILEATRSPTVYGATFHKAVIFVITEVFFRCYALSNVMRSSLFETGSDSTLKRRWLKRLLLWGPSQVADLTKNVHLTPFLPEDGNIQYL